MNRVPDAMQPRRPARQAYDILVSQLIMGYAAIGQRLPEDEGVRDDATGTNQTTISRARTILRPPTYGLTKESVQKAVEAIESTLRRPLKTLDEAAFCSESDERHDPLYRSMVHSLSNARDALLEDMAQVDAVRFESLYKSLQEPFGGWSAAMAFLHQSLWFSLYRGWTWLGLNTIAFGNENTCAMDHLERGIRERLAKLIRQQRVYTGQAYKSGLKEVLEFIRDLIQPTEQAVDAPFSVDPERLEVRFHGEPYRITARQAKYLRILHDELGKWVPGSQLKANDKERPDKVLKRLPEVIRKLITSDQQNGYRLDLPARE